MTSSEKQVEAGRVTQERAANAANSSEITKLREGGSNVVVVVVDTIEGEPGDPISEAFSAATGLRVSGLAIGMSARAAIPRWLMAFAMTQAAKALDEEDQSPCMCASCRANGPVRH